MNKFDKIKADLAAEVALDYFIENNGGGEFYDPASGFKAKAELNSANYQSEMGTSRKSKPVLEIIAYHESYDSLMSVIKSRIETKLIKPVPRMYNRYESKDGQLFTVFPQKVNYLARKSVDFSDLQDKIISSIYVSEPNDEIFIRTNCGKLYKMCHYQDCCESVGIEEIVGDLEDVIGAEILLAEDVSEEASGDYDGSMDYTFYKLATIKGDVCIRWVGESNGYYSTAVDFEEYQGEAQ